MFEDTAKILSKLEQVTKARFEQIKKIQAELTKLLETQAIEKAVNLLEGNKSTEDKPYGVLEQANFSELVESSQITAHIDEVKQKLNRDAKIAKIRARRLPYELQAKIEASCESLAEIFRSMTIPDSKYQALLNE